MNPLRRFVLALLLGLCFPAAAEEDVTRILFIGNSYTGQIRKAVSELIRQSSEADSTEIEFITPGGKTLAFHLENESTIRKIAEGKWDYVVLQDQSQTPAVFPDRFREAALELDRLIDAAGARTVFYQTWGRRDGDKQNAKQFPTYESMQEALSDSYRSVARRSDALLAPVGEAWAMVRKEHPELGVELYKGDGSHPSGKGAYLAACVFYVTLLDPLMKAGLPSPGGDLTEEEAAKIRAAVREIAKPR